MGKAPPEMEFRCPALTRLSELSCISYFLLFTTTRDFLVHTFSCYRFQFHPLVDAHHGQFRNVLGHSAIEIFSIQKPRVNGHFC